MRRTRAANQRSELSSQVAPANRAIARRAAALRSMSRTFSSFSNRNYRLYWFGQLFSGIGTWVQRIAQAWLVLKLTNSSFQLGLVSALQFLPLMCFSLVGGVLADRFPKRRVLLITQSIMAAQALVMATLVATGAIRIWHIYILAMALGLAAAFDSPTRQAFVSEMVGQENLANAVALNSSLFNTARIIGPAIGGALIAAFNLSVAFYVNSVSFLAVIGGLLLMRPQDFYNVPRPARGPVFTRLREGISYASRTPEVALVLILLGFIGTFGYNFTVILPLVAKYVLGTGALGFGGLMTAMGFGSLIAALTMAYLSRPTERILIAGSIAFTVLLALLALSRVLPLTILILIILGFAAITFTSTANSRLQLYSPGEMRGRVMSLYIFMNQGTAPIGSLLIGTLAQQFNVPITLGTLTVLCALGVVLAVLYLERHRPVPVLAVPEPVEKSISD